MMKGNDVVLVIHSAVSGKRLKPARKFEVRDVKPHAQYEQSVTIDIFPPKKRKGERYTATPDGLAFYTIERDGRAIYDSRVAVPIDMERFKATLRESKAEQERINKEEEAFNQKFGLPPGTTMCSPNIGIGRRTGCITLSTVA